MKELVSICETLELSDRECGRFAAAMSAFGSVAQVNGREDFSLDTLYDLNVPGVRELIKLYIHEFSSLYEKTDAYRIYASVPCPTVLAAAFNESGKVRIFTAELCAMVVLRGVLGLDVNLGHSDNNRCAMMENRALYLETGRLPIPDGLWSFGLLCDECCKMDEWIAAETSLKSWQSFCPKPGSERRFAYYQQRLREDIADVCMAAECVLPESGSVKALSLKASVIIAGISCSNSRKPVLKAGTLSLINTAQLCAFGDMEALCAALDLIRKSMRTMPEKAGKKIYNYYIPPCVPELGAIFERNGIALTGDAAFLTVPLKERFSDDLAGAAAAAWSSSILSYDARTNAERTAEAVKKYHCDGYMTGMFAFDRWLGAGHKLTDGTIEQLSGKPVFQCDTDFWGRNFNREKTENLAETLKFL